MACSIPVSYWRALICCIICRPLQIGPCFVASWACNHLFMSSILLNLEVSCNFRSVSLLNPWIRSILDHHIENCCKTSNLCASLLQFGSWLEELKRLMVCVRNSLLAQRLLIICNLKYVPRNIFAWYAVCLPFCMNTAPKCIPWCISLNLEGSLPDLVMVLRRYFPLEAGRSHHPSSTTQTSNWPC